MQIGGTISALGLFGLMSFFAAPAYAADMTTVPNALTLIWSTLVFLCISGVAWLAIEHRAYRRELDRAQSLVSQDKQFVTLRQANDDAGLPDTVEARSVQAA